MNAITDVRKVHPWSIEIMGMPAGYFEECNLPDMEFATIEHSSNDGKMNIKTPGKIKISPLVLKKLCPSERGDNWAYNQMMRTLYNPLSKVLTSFFINHHGTDGTIIERFFIRGAWCQKVTGAKLNKKTEAENVMEEVTYELTDMPIKVAMGGLNVIASVLSGIGKELSGMLDLP